MSLGRVARPWQGPLPAVAGPRAGSHQDRAFSAEAFGIRLGETPLLSVVGELGA